MYDRSDMYQTAGHHAPERPLGSVTDWGYVARRVAYLAAWTSLVVGSWGLFIGLGYSLFLAARLVLSKI